MFKVLVCYHKEYEIPNDKELYLPIQVGKKISDIDLKIQSDDSLNGKSCDNISDQNGLFCEMTAMYWAWKNIRKLYDDIDYVGLCHYRRYFYYPSTFVNKAKNALIYRGKAICSLFWTQKRGLKIDLSIKKIDSCNTKAMQKFNQSLKSILKKKEYDIVTTEPVIYENCKVKDHFSLIGQYHLDLLEKIIAEKYKEYYKAFRKTLYGSELYAANMIILKTELLDEYCSFIFETLNECMKVAVEEKYCYDPLHEKCFSRVLGYLAEILTSTYIEKNNEMGKNIYYAGKVLIG